MESIKLQDWQECFFYGPVEGLRRFCLARGLTLRQSSFIYFPGNKERTWSMFLTEYIIKDNRHSTTSGCKRKGVETCDTKLHP